MEPRHPWDQAKVATIIDYLKRRPGPLLLILRRIQDELGWIPAEAVPMIASALRLSRAEVHGVISFYHDFRDHPPGRHLLLLCRAEACQSVGGGRVADHARARFGIDWHETTADGALTLEPVYCLGLCACGPSAMLDETPLARLDEAQIDALIEAAR